MHSTNDHFILHTLTPDQREEWEERAAIIEADTGKARWAAELQAGGIFMEAQQARARTAMTRDQAPGRQ